MIEMRHYESGWQKILLKISGGGSGGQIYNWCRSSLFVQISTELSFVLFINLCHLSEWSIFVFQNVFR